MIIPPPPGVLGSAILRDPRFGRGPGVYPVKVVGSYTLVTGATYTSPINLCYIPQNSILTDFKIFAGNAVGTLQDSLPSPTVYLEAMSADNIVTTMADMTAASAANLGTMYANTPAAAGANGAQVVQWQQGITLQIVTTTAPSPNAPLLYILEWSPTYDAGV